MVLHSEVQSTDCYNNRLLARISSDQCHTRLQLEHKVDLQPSEASSGKGLLCEGNLAQQVFQDVNFVMEIMMVKASMF